MKIGIEETVLYPGKYLDIIRVPDYYIFVRLLSNLREIQYKISERNAVEHFWVCV